MARLSRILALAALVAATFSAFMWWERYGRWRDCFNEIGRCFDAETGQVYLEQSGVAWGALALLLLALALVLLKPRA